MANTQNESARNKPTEVMPKDYYATLGVEQSASPEDIGRAYRARAKTLHPDRHVGKSTEAQAEAADTFKQVAEAHSVLSDPEKRRAYDLFGKAGVQAGSSVAAGADAAQELFEEMYGLGANAQKHSRKVTGGALFVDGSRGGQFFQRSWDVTDVDKMKAEMAQGLPTVQVLDSKRSCHVMTTSLPHGAWHVRLIDVDADRGVVIVSLLSDGTSASDAEGGAAPLRIERTFTLPAGADVDAVDATVDESGFLKVAVTRADAASPMDDDLAMSSDAPTVKAPMPNEAENAAAAEGAVPPPPPAPPIFVVGEEPTAAPTAAPPKANRAARRRAKHTGLKAGFFNSKPKRSAVAPPAPSRPTSPVSVREELEEAMNPVGP